MRAVTLLLVSCLLAAAEAQDVSNNAAVAAPTNVAVVVPVETKNGCLMDVYIIIQGFILNGIALYYLFMVNIQVYLQCIVMTMLGQYLNLKFIIQIVTAGVLGIVLFLPTTVLTAVGSSVSQILGPIQNEILGPLYTVLDPVLGPLLNPVFTGLNTALSPVTNILGSVVGPQGILNGVVTPLLNPVVGVVGTGLGQLVNTVQNVPVVNSIAKPVSDILGGVLGGAGQVLGLG